MYILRSKGVLGYAGLEPRSSGAESMEKKKEEPRHEGKKVRAMSTQQQEFLFWVPVGGSVRKGVCHQVW